MDIAKIRKKAQEKGKAKAPAGKPEVQVPDEEVREERQQVSRELPAEPPPAKAVAPAPPEEAKADEPVKKAEVSEKPAEDVQPAAEGAEEGFGIDLIELLSFKLGREEFAFRVTDVEEIVKYQGITRVPTMPPYVLGVTSLRGKIIPILDLKIRLGIRKAGSGYVLHDKQYETELMGGKVLIVEGPSGIIGATIDSVVGVVRLPAEKLIEPPGHLTEAELMFLEGVVIMDKRFISVIRTHDAMNIEEH